MRAAVLVVSFLSASTLGAQKAVATVDPGMSREEVVKDVLHRTLSPFDRSIDTHVANLRRKLGHQVNGVERIRTVRGVGYIYAVPPSERK